MYRIDMLLSDGRRAWLYSEAQDSNAAWVWALGLASGLPGHPTVRVDVQPVNRLTLALEALMGLPLGDVPGDVGAVILRSPL